MTSKEAIVYLEWLSNIDFGKKYPTYPMVTNPEQVEALNMAIDALQQLDNNSTKPDNSTATQFNGIESKVKGMTACRVPVDDCISRQAAIDALYKMLHDCFWLDAVITTLNDLPSVQPVAKDTNVPSTELIRRQAAIDALAEKMPKPYTPDGSHPADEGIFAAQEIYADCIQTLEAIPSVQPEPERTMEEFMYGQDMGNPEDGSL